MELIKLLDTDNIKCKLINFFLKEELSALDLGCGNGAYLYMLFHDFNFKRLVGVELKQIDELISDFNSLNVFNPEKIIIGTSIYDIYKKNIWFDEQELLQGKTHLSKEKFDEHFNFFFGKHIQFYNSEEKFDIVILSNVLHLNPDRILIMKSAIEHLNIGGLIYIRVNHPKNDNAIKHNHFEFSDTDFLKLFENDFEQLYLDQNVKFLNSPDKFCSKVFLGKKL